MHLKHRQGLSRTSTHPLFSDGYLIKTLKTTDSLGTFSINVVCVHDAHA